MKIDLSRLDDQTLNERLKRTVRVEKRLTAHIVDCIREVNTRELYKKLGYTSLYAYVTVELQYSSASAQRRIDSARLMELVPELKEDLRSGVVNLMQVSMLAQSVRQKQKETPSVELDGQEQRHLLSKIKNQTLNSTQQILAESLDLAVKVVEKKRVQKDESVRLEVTLTKEQMKKLERVKELISHTHPSLTWAELVDVLAQEFIKRKDPLIERRARKATTGKKRDQVKENTRVDFQMEVKAERPNEEIEPPQKHPRRISAATKRRVFQRDQCCQWKHPMTGQICGSRFQLQIDHKQPVWAGGGAQAENLQLLCSTHNFYRYKQQAGLA
jgi:hypothetical protein